MNKDRLLKLAGLLEADAANESGIKFDLATWAYEEKREYFPKTKRALDCNTTACAVGLACLSGAFKDEGLKWRPSREENNIEPLFGKSEGWNAVVSFFEIGPNDAFYLFADGHYPPGTPTTGADGERAVAERIREFVARG